MLDELDGEYKLKQTQDLSIDVFNTRTKEGSVRESL